MRAEGRGVGDWAAELLGGAGCDGTAGACQERMRGTIPSCFGMLETCPTRYVRQGAGHDRAQFERDVASLRTSSCREAGKQV